MNENIRSLCKQIKEIADTLKPEDFPHLKLEKTPKVEDNDKKEEKANEK